ncbi:MAG TPA: menaquinone biosynthesis protein [Acidobacteriota bacterium]|nr:menaquinone biosynthesis protein [Acidobacteriota bacterium]
MSFIEFLNAVPLGWGLLQGQPDNSVELVLDVPSLCADKLARGETDVGLIPVIEYQRIPGLRVLPGIAIASKHEVRSVLFVSRTPIEKVSRVAVDRASRTSVALLRILLEKFYDNPGVEFITTEPEPDMILSELDAALVIGNTALKIRKQGLLVYDLAGEWNRFTGLPFVFAFWAFRAGINGKEGAQALYESFERGLKSIDEISRVYGDRLNIPAEEVRSYLLTNLDYSLDEPNRRGLECFYSYAAQLGLISEVRPLEFLPVESKTGGTRQGIW